MPDTVQELRLAAAKATRTILQDCRREPDLRRTLSAILSRLGHVDMVAWADADPQAVVDFADGISDLEHADPGFRGMP